MLNRRMRLVLECNKRTPIRLMLRAFNLMTVKQRKIFKTLEPTYKIEQKMVPN